MTSYTAKSLGVALGLSWILGGCAQVGPTKYQALQITPTEQQLIDAKPVYLRSHYRQLFQEGSRNQVLNLMVIGKTALTHGDIEIAAEVFDRAIAQVEQVYSNSDGATKARSLWYEEGAKEFKGEPYERSMLYYYRGLTYLAEEDFENARASFLNAMMQDAFAEEQQYRSDMGSQLLLIGWASQMMGSPELAKEAYDELKKIAPEFELPASDDNTLIIAESGRSPRKLADGVGHSQLVYRRAKKIKQHSVTISNGAQQQEIPVVEDVYWQAASRGGRQIDRVIEGKAQFKQATQDVGKALSDIGTAGIYLSAPLGNSPDLGAGLSLVGVGAMALSAQTRVRADTRYWNNLPNKLHLTTLNNKTINGDTLLVRYHDAKGNIIKEVVPTMIKKGRKQTLIWSSGEYNE